MLHVSLRSGQVCAPRWLAALLCVLLGMTASTAFSQESTATTAAALASAGRHLEAAAQYEKSARRGFFSWDADLALLAAREYAAAGELEEAERMLGKARGRVRDDASRTLLIRTEAEIALGRGDPMRALVVLRTLPEPQPIETAADLLALRARAEFATGLTIAGLRTLEARRDALATPAERQGNDRFLLDQLLLYPPRAEPLPPGLSENERGWLELALLLPIVGDAARQGDPEVVARTRSWMQQHPGHPGTGFLPGAVAGPGAQFAAAPGGAAAVIAVLLPLSGKQQSAGTAVRDGVVAGWFASGTADTRPRLLVFDSAELGAATAYERAVAQGAQAVIGPLVREEVAAVIAARQGALPVPTLALNSPAGPALGPPPAFLVQFSLDPEQEARGIARRIAADSLARGVALFPDSTWGQRVRDAFSSELSAAGVTLMSAQFYPPGAQDFSEPLRAALGRFGGAGARSLDPAKPLPPRNPEAERAAGPQFAFIAASAPTARAMKPQLRFQMTYDLPIYATSDAWDASVRAAGDMDGLLFPEMPWILNGGQGAPELWDALQQEWAAQGRGRLRLYAFGFDAYRLATQLRGNTRFIGIDGLTGNLTVTVDGHVQRTLEFARVTNGRPQAAGSGAPAAYLPQTTGNAAGDPLQP